MSNVGDNITITFSDDSIHAENIWGRYELPYNQSNKTALKEKCLRYKINR